MIVHVSEKNRRKQYIEHHGRPSRASISATSPLRTGTDSDAEVSQIACICLLFSQRRMPTRHGKSRLHTRSHHNMDMASKLFTFTFTFTFTTVISSTHTYAYTPLHGLFHCSVSFSMEHTTTRTQDSRGLHVWIPDDQIHASESLETSQSCVMFSMSRLCRLRGSSMWMYRGLVWHIWHCTVWCSGLLFVMTAVCVVPFFSCPCHPCARSPSCMHIGPIVCKCKCR